MSIQKQIQKTNALTATHYTYASLAQYLDTHWNKKENNLEVLKQLDALCGSPSKQLKCITISGTNGKSLTAHFTSKLLQEEGFSVGTLYTPHTLYYNERFAIDGEVICQKTFVAQVEETLAIATQNNLSVSSQELLLQAALCYFLHNKVDVVVLESEKATAHDVTTLCRPLILGITRITAQSVDQQGHASQETIQDFLTAAQATTTVISADQNKANLKSMQDYVTSVHAAWAMPIRKLTPLAYPYEQLHGRCAALAERIASIFINEHAYDAPQLSNESLLKKVKGQRGRPTLDSKKKRELNPKKTIEDFWKETISTLPSHFQFLEKEKPYVLIDNANNIDALKNALLGIRLLHYKKTLKNLVIILSAAQETLQYEEFLKEIRYFFKKTSGSLVICPTPVRADLEYTSWNVEKITQDLKATKIKVRSALSFKEAFESSKRIANDRNSLIAIIGPNSFVAQYWQHKGTKKL